MKKSVITSTLAAVTIMVGTSISMAGGDRKVAKKGPVVVTQVPVSTHYRTAPDIRKTPVVVHTNRKHHSSRRAPVHRVKEPSFLEQVIRFVRKVDRLF